jgi:hypothetical protein
LAGEHDGAHAIALRQRGGEIDVPMYEPCAGAAAAGAAAFLGAAAVDFLGGMAEDIGLDVEIERYRMLLASGQLPKSIVRFAVERLWEITGMGSAFAKRAPPSLYGARPKRQCPPDQQFGAKSSIPI